MKRADCIYVVSTDVNTLEKRIQLLLQVRTAAELKPEESTEQLHE